MVKLDGLAAWLRERHPLAWLAVGAMWLTWFVSLAVGGWSHDVAGLPIGADHVEYYVVGQLVNEGRAGEVYDLPTMKARQEEVGGPHWPGPLPFRYPPFYALVFAPTSLLPYWGSWLVWTALSLLALGLSVRVLEGRWSPRALGWALCFLPVFTAVAFGQNGLISLAILACTFGLLGQGHPFLAGLLGGLLLYKPQLLVGVGLLWLLRVRRRWPALLGLGVTGGVLMGLAWLLIPEAVERFLFLTGTNATIYDRQPMAKLYATQGFWILLLPPGLERLAQGLSLGCSLLAALALAWLCRFGRDEAARFAGAVALTLLISPYAMIYDWSILLVPALVLARSQPAEAVRWEVVFALVWLAALLSWPLAQFLLLVSPVAVQASVPALAGAVALAWPRLVREKEEGVWP